MEIEKVSTAVLNAISKELENNDYNRNFELTETLHDDLGIDSMGFITVICEIENQLGMRDDMIDIESLDFEDYRKLTVQNLIDIIFKYLKEG